MISMCQHVGYTCWKINDVQELKWFFSVEKIHHIHGRFLFNNMKWVNDMCSLTDVLMQSLLHRWLSCRWSDLLIWFKSPGWPVLWIWLIINYLWSAKVVKKSDLDVPTLVEIQSDTFLKIDICLKSDICNKA